MNTHKDYLPQRIALATIFGAMAAACVGPAVSRLLQLQPNEQWPHWTILFLVIGGILFIAAMLIVIVAPRIWMIAWRYITRVSPQKMRQERVWDKYRPEVVVSSIKTHYCVDPITHKVKYCRIYLSLTMAARYTDGYTYLAIEDSDMIVKQKLGGEERPYKLHPILNSNNKQGHTRVTRGQKFVVFADFVSGNEDDEESLCPHLDKEFEWELSGLVVHFEGGNPFQYTMPTLSEVYNAPK